MEDMKWDMGGAAVTAAIMKYLSEINPNFSYAGIVGLVENIPSSTAYKPGEIILATAKVKKDAGIHV